jgi:putative restriction endonuclease
MPETAWRRPGSDSIVDSTTGNVGVKTSQRLEVGKAYTRAELAQLFGIQDQRLYHGVFLPPGTESIWLFVTESSAPGMMDYKNSMEGDDLYMDGQRKGSTDQLLIRHEHYALELLVFYRGSGKARLSAFVYYGPFQYVSHSGSNPAHFRFQKIDR